MFEDDKLDLDGAAKNQLPSGEVKIRWANIAVTHNNANFV